MDIKILQIMEKISDGTNILFYNKNVYDCYEQLQDDYICIYFNEHVPAKIRLIKIINEVSGTNNHSLSRLTIPELKEILVKELGYKRLILIFNHFERLTQRTVQIYQSLNSLKNIQFVCSFSDNFKEEVFPFYTQFELVNKKECKEKPEKDEINVTYPVYILLSLICFFCLSQGCNFTL